MPTPDLVTVFSSILSALTVVAVFFGTNALKKFIPSIPKFLVPIVALLVSVLVQYLVGLATGTGVDPYLAVLYSWLAGRIADIWKASTE